MNTWKVILATMVIFATGVITGGLLVKNATGRASSRPPQMAARTNQPAVMPGQIQRMDFLLRARNELGLTPEQHQRIETIIREGQEKSRKLWDSVSPEMRNELQVVREKIRAELTPEQRRRFEDLMRNPPRMNQGPGPGPNNPGNEPEPPGSPGRFRDRPPRL